ncbi:unnamed protein product [Tilletia controversa]|uniref:Double-strand-break repair protein rad21 n=3 Tax=Tilletia TaxID=13289 RepID=A0A8X7MU64_9BASI|nr:hypothetical protein CF336_g6376 [Tilletia laevis]KAE8190011.1 hypothetical protein CF328_g6105 [Tilletia controversa]KAE8257003.1 hypothetical protein A4X03_0g4840 [Tilletia caries]KAE8192996.1 hypothetical protein CF335_g5703 [Tilletia laevis]KAE8247769.1 hypothetical protein A4X06_0g4211 [Tilletia controversa]
MFYSDVILTKRGPLARVWLAAHWERKLSKAQFLQTDIEKSVDAIMGQGTVPMALRLSGQLLLGVARIYSRKTKYLLDDCNEALLKIKMAFRAGAVDLTSDQLTAPRHTITLQPTRTEFDLMMPNQLLQAWNVDPYLQKPLPGSGHASAVDRARSRSRSATPARAFGMRPSERAHAQGAFGVFAENDSDFGLDSQDYNDSALLDLGMGDDIAAAERSRLAATARRSVPGAPRERGISTGGPSSLRHSSVGSEIDDSFGVGVGRDAAPDAGMDSLGSALGNLDDGMGGFGLDANMDMGFDFGADDMPNLDLGFGPDLGLDSVDQSGGDVVHPPRVSTPEPEDSFQAALANVTPRTAAKIREAAERRTQAQMVTTSKSRRQIVDRFTELADSAASQNALMQWSEDRYLPRSRAELELLSIKKDPASHFFPWFEPGQKDNKAFFFGSRIVATELQELFTFDLTAIQRKRSVSPGPDADSDAGRSAKRLRSDDGDLESEVGRRADPLRELSFGPFGDNGAPIDFSMGGDDNFGAMDFGAQDEAGMDAFSRGAEQLGDQDGQDGGDDGSLRRSLRKLNPDGSVVAAPGGDDDRPALGRLSTLTRLSTPEVGEPDFAADVAPSPSNPLAAFAARPSDAQADLNVGAEAAASDRDAAKTGLSRNTVRAVKVLKSQLREPVAGQDAEGSEAEREDEGQGKSKTMSFEQVSNKATRRAAAGFFFELLVLATKDCVKIKQEESYGDVEIQAKQKLWQISTV